MAGPPSKKGRYHGDLANADAETGRVYVWDANRSAWRLTTTEDAVKFSTQAREHQKQKQNGTSESNVQITQGGSLSGRWRQQKGCLQANTMGATRVSDHHAPNHAFHPAIGAGSDRLIAAAITHSIARTTAWAKRKTAAPAMTHPGCGQNPHIQTTAPNMAAMTRAC